MPAPRVITFGCRLNAHEADAIEAEASAASAAETVIVNTCAVTGEAVRQGRQAIRRARREGPHARIVATGCAAQIDPTAFAAMAEVDHVVGNREKLRRDTYERIARGDGPRVAVGDLANGDGPWPARARPTAARRVRAYLPVQGGCDHRCTFCVIPLGRGPSRSRLVADVLDEVRHLADLGYREVVLTGVDLTSYGADLPAAPTLGRLVRAVLREVPELDRLRLSSLDQIEVDDELLATLAEEPRLMPHLHLSLQSGDDIVLKRMKRRHLRRDAVRFAETVRRLRPDVVLGADLIAGFPTETEDMFRRSLDIVDACELTYVHVFPFSPRPQTPAARMPQVAGPVIRERAERLRSKARRALHDHLAGQAGREVEVLMERGGAGRTPQFAPVVPAGLDRDRAGDIVRVRIDGRQGDRLTGVAVATDGRQDAAA